MATAAEGQLQRIIRDMHDAVTQLINEHKELGEPITDDSTNLHKFSYKLEYLLQFDQKEKTTFLGTKKDYWDYFHDCLAKIKGANDGIRFVKSISELKTSLGKGRAFIRYSLVHQRLGDTLQQCLMNQKATGDWFFSRSPLLKPHLSVDIINYLYELNEVQFDLASRGYDLDSAWPTFARRTLGLTNSPSHMWKPPSRSSSINSLASSYSQQAPEFLSSPDFGHGLLNDLTEPAISAMDELRLELDQSELKQVKLVEQIQQLGVEATDLRDVVGQLQKQLDISLAAQENHKELQLKLQVLSEKEQTLVQELEVLRGREGVRETANKELQDKLVAVGRKNEELMAKLDGVLDEKGQRAASHFDSAQKIHELLDSLKGAEKERIAALADAEENKRQAERLAEELRLKQQALNDGEKKMSSLTAKGERLTKQADEQRNAMEKLQNELSVREKEVSSLQKDLQDLQNCLETMELQAAAERKSAVMEREELQTKLGSLKENLEGQMQGLRAQLETKETELLTSTKRFQQMEVKMEMLVGEKQNLGGSVTELEAKVKDQIKKVNEYKEQCSSLMELNAKLLQTAKATEGNVKDLTERKSVLESELAAVRASEKQLEGQLEDAKLSVDEKERRIREDNRSLDEKLQMAHLQAKESESLVHKLEQENGDLQEELGRHKDMLTAVQDELRNFTGKVEDLEKDFAESKHNETNLITQLKEKDSQLDDRDRLNVELKDTIESLEAQKRELKEENEKAEKALERQSMMIETLEVQGKAVEKAQVERSTCLAKETKEMTFKVGCLEQQLDQQLKEVSRLQDVVVDLKAKLQSAVEDKVKTESRLEITEAAKTDLQTLTEQLKKQVEEQNRAHVNELLQSKHCMEEMSSKLEAETCALTKTATDYATAQKDMNQLKAQNEKLVLENSETRDGLHRVNTEMAELGMTVCKLTAELEEAAGRGAADAVRIKELEEQREREVERLIASVTALHQENGSLREELQQFEKLPETILELKEQLDNAVREKEVMREETAAVRFQMSSENMTHQNLAKNLREELDISKDQLRIEKEKTTSLESRVSELEEVNSSCSRLMGEKDSHITKAEGLIRSGDDEIQLLKEKVTSMDETLKAAQQENAEMQEKLVKATTEAQTLQIRMAAEIEDLGHTKTTLEERLIELIRDKDALWQKTDALEFEQKLRAAEEWWLVDREATHCLSCKSPFSWRLRKHHCRLCGRIFCYYCSNNFVTTKSGSKKERCCAECYTQHNVVSERFTRAELNNPAEPPTDNAPPPPSYKPTPRVTVTDPTVKQDDGAFDIITDEEVNGLYDDSLSQSTAGSQEEAENQNTKEPGLPGDAAAEEQEETPVAVQDAELNLLRSGDLTSSLALHMDEISQINDAPNELFVKSSCYSVIAITVDELSHTVSWIFTSEPKSISFSVVYKESNETPVEQAKVLIPLTRCSAHKEKIQGSFKPRNPGVYLLIFDNSFSRFISKKVNYHLTTEKPVIYDGSDSS